MNTPKRIHEKLPYEVLAHAFSFLEPTSKPLWLDASRTTAGGHEGTLMQAHEFPVMLSLVCKTWRYIVLCIPRLWATVRIRIMKTPITRDTLDAAQVWLKKSKELGCHLSLELSLHVIKSSDPDLMKDLVLDLIQPIASRLETLVLCTPTGCLWSLQNLSPFHLPRLQTFIIRAPKYDSTQLRSLPNLPENAFAQCNSLKNLELTHPLTMGIFQSENLTPNPDFTNLTIFPYASLHSLKLTDLRLSVRMAIDIFHLSTELHYCELKISALTLGTHTPIASNHPRRTGPRIHPNLRVLKLRFTGGFISNFFCALRTDLFQLEDLTITCTPDARNLQATGFAAALREFTVWHPMLSLKRLDIRRVLGMCSGNGARQVLDLLRTNDNIKELVLNGLDACTNRFVNELIWSKASTVPPQEFGGKLLPKLKNFSLLDREALELTDDVLLAFLCSRWDGIGASHSISSPPTRLRELQACTLRKKIHEKLPYEVLSPAFSFLDPTSLLPWPTEDHEESIRPPNEDIETAVNVLAEAFEDEIFLHTGTGKTTDLNVPFFRCRISEAKVNGRLYFAASDEDGEEKIVGTVFWAVYDKSNKTSDVVLQNMKTFEETLDPKVRDWWHSDFVPPIVNLLDQYSG
ncbi:hypothetical protein BDN72DRAFT_964390 [Pluteus cervinus]|uniref:Uncharacterized protein n=1 Tax=Pluteus cervinus TaxID=181527 RepID=A0ACD3AAA6_9AGAR|nr:hypothetical protein BDN72DRAFT_964390 [Pluteus cervinus]